MACAKRFFSIFFEPIDGLQNKAERKNFYLAKSKDKEKVTSSVQKNLVKRPTEEAIIFMFLKKCCNSLCLCNNSNYFLYKILCNSTFNSKINM